LIAATAALITGDVYRLALTGGALISFWSAGVFAFRGLVEETRYRLGQQLWPSRFPWKLAGAIPTALGSLFAALSAGHDVPAALAFAFVGALGHVTFIGTDPRRRRIVVRQADGVDCGEVVRQLEHAHRRLRALEGVATSLALPEFRARV